MRKRIACFLALAVMIVFLTIASADIPHLINYQGTLTDENGLWIEGKHTITFRIYPDSLNGPELWMEQHDSVEVLSGVFSVILGSGTAVPDSLFEGDERWMSIAIDDDPEMNPRMRITSVPWAMRAAEADHALVSDTALSIAGLPEHDHDDMYFTESELQTAGTINDPSNPVNWTKLKNVPSGFADGVDNVGGGGGWVDDGTVVRLETGTDNVGIGTSTPSAKLVVGSDIGAVDASVTAIAVGDASDVISGHSCRLFLGKNENNRGWLSWSVDNKRLSLSTKESGVSYQNTVVLRSNKVGIGTLSPSAKLVVNASDDSLLNVAEFKTSYDAQDIHVVDAQYKGTGQKNAVAVYGKSRPSDGHGIGGQFYGGEIGVDGRVGVTGSGWYIGVQGKAEGGAGENKGVYGFADGSGTNYGVYGEVGTGGGYAGYFFGKAYVKDRLTVDANVKVEDYVRVGADLGTYNGSQLTVGDQQYEPSVRVGKDSNNHGYMTWKQGDECIVFGTKIGGTGYSNSVVLNSGNIGIGLRDPLAKLHVFGDVPQIRITREEDEDSTSMDLQVGTSGAGINVLRPGTGDGLNLKIDGNTKVRIASGGAVGIGTTTPQYKLEVAGPIMLEDLASPPPAARAGHSGIYSDSGALWAINENGDTAPLSPLATQTGEWIFYSKNIKTGRVVRVNMERLIRKVEELTGEKFLIEEWE